MLTTVIPPRRACGLPVCVLLTYCMFLAGLVAGSAMIGCAPFAPGADKVVVTAERSIAASFDTVDSFISFDDQHRDALRANAPSVHAVAERLRRDAPATFRQADEAVRTYKAVKSAENKSKLDAALDLAEALARQARAALTEARAKGIGG